jgi:Mn-dependent DtxR family transcriptional regulator
MSSPLSTSNEDYLERISELIEKKGYARVSDIAEILNIKPASVTRMVQKLESLGYLNVEKYRGLTLTEKGKTIGKRIGKRHTILKEFLTYLNIPTETLEKDIDGLEHHLSDITVEAIADLTESLKKK